MLKKLRSILLLLSAVLIISCPAAPPLDPINSSELYLTPSAVTGLTATNGKNNEIRLTWEPSANADSYQVWMIDSKNYGTSSESLHGSSYNYSKLQERGFSFIGTVKDTRFDLVDIENNKAYVFAVVAMKNIGSSSASINNRVLYSDVTTFTEGSTIGDISISALSTSKRISVFWDVQNLFTVIPKVPGTNERLYDYKFSINYKEKKQKEWSVIEIEPNSMIFSKELVYSDLNLKLDTVYEVKVVMDVFNGDELINTIESITLPIATSVDFSIDPIISINATAGTKTNSIVLSWETPSIPSGITFKNVFKIERAVSNDAGESQGDWIEIMSPQEFDRLDADNPARKSFTWEDTKVADNTKYIYRITNGYKKDNGTFIMQDGSSSITTSNVAWKTWIPSNINATFSKESSGNPNSGTIKLSFDYPETNDPLLKWTLITNVWDETTGQTSSSFEDIQPVFNTNKYEYTKTITTDNVNKLSVYTFNLKLTFDSEVISTSDVKVNETVSLGNSSITKLINDDSLKASNDLVGQVKLTWSVIEGVTNDEYKIFENNVEKQNIDQSLILKEGLNRSIILDTNAATNYRISVTATYSDESKTYNCPTVTQGDILSAPIGLAAEDGQSTNELKITWNAPESNINIAYEIEYREKGQDNWTNKSVDAATGALTLTEKEIQKKGQVYQFRMKAYNKLQDDISGTHKYTEYSSMEEGNLFGADGINLVASNGTNPKVIELSWTPVPGADSYKVLRDGVELPGQVNGKRSTYEDRSILDIIPDQGNPEPLSKEYTYTLKPIKAGLDSTQQSKAAKGKLFAPPSNITATKGEHVGKVLVTWDAVPDVSSYTLQKYKIVNEELVPVGDQILHIETNSYDDITSIEPVYYSVKAIRNDGVESEYQTGFFDETNFFGDVEPKNLGYRLLKPRTLSLTEVIDEKGFYAPYVKVEWSRAEGATGYIISVLDSNTQIDLNSSFTNKSGTIWTNDKSENEAGYLAYNTETKMFTYNDATGSMKDSLVINGYAVASSKNISISEQSQNNTGVRRGILPTDIVLINMVNEAIYKPLHEVDDKIKHDWWLDNGVAWKNPSDDTYSDSYPGFVAHRQTYGITGSYPSDGSNYFKLTNINFGNLIINSQDIRINIENNTGGNLGTGYLARIGCFDSEGANSLDVTINEPSLPGKYKKYSIKYNEILVRNGVDTNSTYKVTVDRSTATINDSSDIKRPF